jgi:hypothetical protein
MSLPFKPKVTTTTAEEEKRKLLKELDRIEQELLRLPMSELSGAIPKRKEELKIIREKMRSLRNNTTAMQTLRVATINDIVPALSSPEKLVSMNRGLIHLLQIINKAPNGQISTRKLLDTLNSRDLHRLIIKGEELGFIKRDKVPKPPGQKGNNMMVNSLTEEGRALLKVANKISTSTDS